MEKKIAFSTNSLGIIGLSYAKKSRNKKPHTMYKKLFKMDHRLEHKPKTMKLLEENIGEKLLYLV